MMPNNLVVIPIYNEAKNLPSVFTELRRFYHDDVLAIDDGSTDGSLAVLTKLLKSKHMLASQVGGKTHIISHERNQGYGTSLMAGFQYATIHGYHALVTMDCDWQHEPKQVPEFFKSLLDYDVISGSRYLNENDTNHSPPPERKKINEIITEEINRITKYNISDAFCGFKAYRVSSLKRLCLSEGGYAFPLQFWIQAYSNSFRVKEIPVARIYADPKRSFGKMLDDPNIRLKYYLGVIEKELRCRSKAYDSKKSPSARCKDI